MIRAALALTLLCALSLRADLPVPALTGPLVDQARLFSSREDQDLRLLLEALNRSGKLQMAVLVVDSLEGEPIESFSMRVAEKWKLGKKGRDDGLLLVIAPKDRRMRFEVGYGLEGDLPDAMAKRIQSETLVPFFREQRYAEGTRAALYAVGQRLGIVLSGDSPRPPVVRHEPKIHWEVLLFFLVVAFFPLMGLLNGGRARRRGSRWFDGGGWGGGSGWGGGGGWSGGGGFGGGSSGGGFSGGGGGFGGGGSSSSW